MINRLIDWGYEIRNRRPEFKALAACTCRAVRWLNHFRHRDRKNIDGITYELDLAEELDGTIYFKGGFEPDTAAALKVLARPGDIAFDVGANIGCHALLLAKLVPPGGRVVVIKPTEWARQKFIRNAALNPHMGHLSLEKMAVPSESLPPCEIAFRASWRTFGRKLGTFTEAIEVTTINDYVKRPGLLHLDFIKIDVDGFEQKVICWAKRTLERWAPALAMEFGMYTLADVGDDLKSLVSGPFSEGYLIFHERMDEPSASYEQIAGNIPEGQTINVICVHRNDARLANWMSRAPSSFASTYVGS